MIFQSLNTLRNLIRTQYLPRYEIERFQSMRLRAVIKHAYDNVKYYQNLFDRTGVTPEDIKTAGDLLKIPITKKEDLQKMAPQDLLSNGTKAEGCIVKSTSGSTGTPMRFFFSENERDFQTLLNLRIFHAGGLKLTDTTAYLINPHRFPKGRYWFQHIGILRRYYLSVFDTAEVHANVLRRINPDVIYGYPSNLMLLALMIKERGIDNIRPKAVFSSAEALEQKPRALIASAMNTNVYDILGLVETGDIAWECPAQEGYHVNSDAVVMEFLDEKDKPVKAGESGRLVCTNLYGYTMPLIRYEAGDICVPSDKMCSCGRTLPMMESLKGRANDFIVLPGGSIIASCFLVIIMQAFHDVAQYRVIQENREGIIVQLVKGNGFNSQTVNRIKEEIKKVTQNRLRVDIVFFDVLPRDASGKIRTVICKINHDYLPLIRE